MLVSFARIRCDVANLFTGESGVKVQTTVRKLIRAVYDPTDQWASLKYFLGRVSYKSQEELLNIFANPDDYIATLTNASARGPVRALLLKRREFEHEKEVRLIYQDTEDSPDDYALIPIDPLDLFDEVVFDPRMPIFSYEAFSAYIKAQGFEKPISRSELYQLPEIRHKISIRSRFNISSAAHSVNVRRGRCASENPRRDRQNLV